MLFERQFYNKSSMSGLLFFSDAKCNEGEQKSIMQQNECSSENCQF